MECPQYSIRLEALGICALFTSCIRRGLVSCDLIVDRHWLPASLRLTDVSVICRAVNPRPTSQKILGEGLLYGVYRPGE